MENMNAKKQTVAWLLSDESFRAWLAGKASAEASSQWNDWLRQSPDHRLLRDEAKDLLGRVRFPALEAPNLDWQWEKLRRQLSTKTPTASIFASLVAAFADWQGRRRQWPRYALAMAAAVLMVVAAQYFHVFDRLKGAPEPIAFQTVSTQFGQRSTIDLPEGTRIILNANSILRFPDRAWENPELRFELEGEAYFEVSSRKEKPGHGFTVHTTDGAVRVTGTRFVVHERGPGTRVVVEEGEVEITVADTTAARPVPGAKVFLKPGNLLQFQKGDRHLSPQLVHVGPYITWWRDRLILEDTPFGQIVKRLEETYGIEVDVKDKVLLQQTLSGAIENRNLDVTTEALAKVLRVSVRRKGQVVIFGR